MYTLAHLTSKYSLSALTLIHVRVAADEGAEQRFCRLADAFCLRCAELKATEEWDEILFELRWASLLIRAVPLPVGDNVLFPAALLSRLQRLTAELSDVKLRTVSGELIATLEELADRVHSPLAEEMIAYLLDHSAPVNIAVLAYDKKLVTAIGQALMVGDFPAHISIKVCDWPDLSRTTGLDQICFFGSARMRNYPPGLYKCGLSHVFVRTAYAWTKADPHPRPWFEAPEGYKDGIWDTCRFTSEARGELWSGSVDLPASDPAECKDNTDLPGDDYFDSEELPEAGIMRQAEYSFAEADNKVRARPVYLSGNRVVYLSPSLREDVFILQPGNAEPQEVPVMDLRPGDYLVVPEGINRDYRQVLIDQNLGKSRDACRERQQEWKKGLAEKIARNGLQVTITQLRALGCRRANEPNLYNWAYGSVICPQRRLDFESIMHYLGYNEEHWVKSIRLLKRILSASHQVSDTMLAEMRKGLARLDVSSLSGLDEQRLILPLSGGTIKFTLVRVTGLGPVSEVSRDRYEIVTTR